MSNHLNTTADITVSIGTANTAGTWEYAPLREGIDTIEEAVNSQNQQYFFMNKQGFAHNEVTGMAPQYTVSGKRVYGDKAQDYICGLKYQLGEARKTSVKLEWTDNSGEAAQTVTIVCDATILDIRDLGGATTDNTPFSCVIALDGKPEVTRV